MAPHVTPDELFDPESETIELDLLLEAVFRKYGYDFRDYSRAHIKRRVTQRIMREGMRNVAELQHTLLRDRDCFERLLLDFSINVTEMFRDPAFYLAVRQEVVPLLKTWPFIKIWHAGCATGEEVYSMAILLKEEGLFQRVRIYATDFNQDVLRRAEEGIYSIENIKDYTVNYQKGGGIHSFADYYTAKYDSVMIDPAFKERITFADHNLVTDGVFGEMHMIVCRNVLIYFSRTLQNRVLGLFAESLCPGGFLCLGSKESLRFSEQANKFESVVERERIFQRRMEP